MRGLKAAELEAMVDFLYFGEASVEQESLETLLGLAEELKLEGVTSSLTEANRNELRGKEAALQKKITKRKHTVKTTPSQTKPLDFNSSGKGESSPPYAMVSVEEYQLEEQVKSMMTVTGKRNDRKVWACNICGKEGRKENMKVHIESSHIASNISHFCDICGKTSRSRDRFWK